MIQKVKNKYHLWLAKWYNDKCYQLETGSDKWLRYSERCVKHIMRVKDYK